MVDTETERNLTIAAEALASSQKSEAWVRLLSQRIRRATALDETIKARWANDLRRFAHLRHDPERISPYLAIGVISEADLATNPLPELSKYGLAVRGEAFTNWYLAASGISITYCVMGILEAITLGNKPVGVQVLDKYGLEGHVALSFLFGGEYKGVEDFSYTALPLQRLSQIGLANEYGQVSCLNEAEVSFLRELLICRGQLTPESSEWIVIEQNRNFNLVNLNDAGVDWNTLAYLVETFL